jgi:tetratricopeptide (TPR) repeat protein
MMTDSLMGAAQGPGVNVWDMAKRAVSAEAAAGQGKTPRQVNDDRDADSGARELTVVHRPPAWRSRERPAWGAATGQISVGPIPQQPSGYLPRPVLFAQLNQACRGSSVVQVVTGTEGAGKSQLAAAYARAKLAAGWRLVAWINAENSGSLLTGLAAVADAAGLSYASYWRDAADAGRAIRHRLEVDGDDCLVVFDDVDDAGTVLPFLPAGGQARVLITTRRQSVAGLGTSVPVDMLSEQESLVLLDGRAGWCEPEAAMVAAELGYLPLALAQAAVVGRLQSGYEAYLKRLRAASVDRDTVGERQETRPEKVAKAILLSLDAVHAADETGVRIKLLEIMALLSAAGIRRDFLSAAGQVGALSNDGSRVSATTVDRALEWLADASLLNFSLGGRTITVHCLIADVIRERAVRRGTLMDACRGAAASVLEVHASAHPQSRDRSTVMDIPQQVAALLDHLAGISSDIEDGLGKILFRLRFLALYYLLEQGGSARQAITVGESLTADLERELGADHPDTLNSRNSLAAAHQAAGQVAKAVPLFELVLAGREEVLGSDHPHTLTSRNNLAAAYQDAGRITEAIPLFEQTLIAREEVLGPDHSSTLSSAANLAAAYQDAGETDKAIRLLEQVLVIREQLLGVDNPRTLSSRKNLATAYQDAGRIAEAIPLFEHTLSVWERVLGPDHPDTMKARNDLANAYRKTHQVAKAIPLLERTLAACERLLDPEDSRTQVTRHNLALAYQAAGLSE